jgi:hypothetical protein
VAFANYKKYLINHMIIDGQDANDFSQIQSHVVQFYKDLFGKWGVTWGSFSLDIWENCEKIGVENNSFLIAQFSEKKFMQLFLLWLQIRLLDQMISLLDFINVFGI